MIKKYEQIRKNYLGDRKIEKTIEQFGAIIYLYTTTNNEPALLAFSGKRSKPDLFYCYWFKLDRDDAIKKYLENLEKKTQVKKEYQKPNELKIGDILNYTWGYEQTNQNFYQVLKVKGQFVIIQEIVSKTIETGYMSGNCTPIKDKFLKNSEPMRKKVIFGNAVKINSFGWCEKWDRESCSCSWYA